MRSARGGRLVLLPGGLGGGGGVVRATSDDEAFERRIGWRPSVVPPSPTFEDDLARRLFGATTAEPAREVVSRPERPRSTPTRRFATYVAVAIAIAAAATLTARFARGRGRADDAPDIVRETTAAPHDAPTPKAPRPEPAPSPAPSVDRPAPPRDLVTRPPGVNVARRASVPRRRAGSPEPGASESSHADRAGDTIVASTYDVIPDRAYDAAATRAPFTRKIEPRAAIGMDRGDVARTAALLPPLSAVPRAPSALALSLSSDQARWIGVSATPAPDRHEPARGVGVMAQIDLARAFDRL